jgi:hypothetical protein
MTMTDNHFNTLRVVPLAEQIQKQIDSANIDTYVLEAAIMQMQCELYHILHHIAEERARQWNHISNVS